MVTAGLGDAFSGGWIGFAGDGLSMYKEETLKELNKAMEDNAKVWVIARRGFFDSVDMTLVIDGKSKSDAKDIRKALKNYHDRLKEKIDEAKSEEEEKDEDDKTPAQHLKYRKLRRTMAWRALKKAYIELDDLRIIFTAKTATKESEQKKLAKFHKWRTKLATVATRVVAAMAEGKDPKDADLKKIGGAKLVKETKLAKTFVKMGWQERPANFYKIKELRIPGGYDYNPKYRYTGFIHRYNYNYSIKKLKKGFKALYKADGWKTITEKKKTYLVKGDYKIKLSYGEPSLGGSQLDLVIKRQ